jgi:hypothetical protein
MAQIQDSPGLGAALDKRRPIMNIFQAPGVGLKTMAPGAGF